MVGTADTVLIRARGVLYRELARFRCIACDSIWCRHCMCLHAEVHGEREGAKEEACTGRKREGAKEEACTGRKREGAKEEACTGRRKRHAQREKEASTSEERRS